MLPPDLTDKYLVIVEGKGDETIFAKLCAHAGTENVFFDSPNQDSHGGFGKDHFFSLLRGLTPKRGFAQAKGIVLMQDSDDDPTRVLPNLQNQIRAANDSLKREDRSYGVPQEFLKPTYGDRTPPVVTVSVPW